MEKAEIKRIASFLRDVYEGICEQDGTHAQRMQLTELYGVIQILMDEIAKTKGIEERVLPAYMEKKARRCKQHIESRLMICN